jgi:hypothetical protein
MSWLICGIGSFIVAACIFYMAFDSKKKKRKVWFGVYSTLFIMNILDGILTFATRIDYSKVTVIIQIICASVMVVLVLLNIFLNYKTKKLDEEIAKTEEKIKANEEEIAKLKKSEWGWESEFLKVEFINSETRSEFDKEVEKIKNDYEDLNDAVGAIWRLIERFDSDKIEVPDKDKLGQSIWDYLQE